MELKLETTDKHILLNGLPVYFYIGDHRYVGVNDVFVQHHDGGVSFRLRSSEPTTMVVPCHSGQIIVGDDFEPLNRNVVSNFYYAGPTSLLSRDDCAEISAPYAHIVFSEKAWSCSVFGECRIACFKSNFEQYVSLTGIPDVDHITFHIDATTNYRVSLARMGVQPKTVSYSSGLSRSQVEYALLHGAKVRRAYPDVTINIAQARALQSSLNSHELYSVITGSLARALNGQSCAVRDVDLMFKTKYAMQHAALILKDTGYEVVGSSEKRIQLQREQELVDLSWDNYNLLTMPHHVRENDGLRYLDAEGLLWIALLSAHEWFFNKSRIGYPQNQQALYDCTRHAFQRGLPCSSVIGEEIIHYDAYLSNCEQLCDELSHETQLFVDTRVNEPFRANTFGDQTHRLYSVVNMGTVSDLRLVTDFIPTTAEFEDIAGRKIVGEIEKQEGFSMIFLKGVDLPGVLRCR